MTRFAVVLGILLCSANWAAANDAIAANLCKSLRRATMTCALLTPARLKEMLRATSAQNEIPSDIDAIARRECPESRQLVLELLEMKTLAEAAH